jgi:hypothetical protein
MVIFGGSFAMAGHTASGQLATVPPNSTIKFRRFIQHLRPSAIQVPHRQEKGLPHQTLAAL